MTVASDRAATEICSALEYLADRGETGGVFPMTHVRYTEEVVPNFSVSCMGREIRFDPVDIGPAPQYDEDEEDE